ncbi:MAG: hypothetical protein ACXAC7_15615 [Candidatus Hodarchaeales archaeon]
MSDLPPKDKKRLFDELIWRFQISEENAEFIIIQVSEYLKKLEKTMNFKNDPEKMKAAIQFVITKLQQYLR